MTPAEVNPLGLAAAPSRGREVSFIQDLCVAPPTLVRADAEEIDEAEAGEEDGNDRGHPTGVEEGVAPDVVALLPPPLLTLPQLSALLLLLRLVCPLLCAPLPGLLLLLFVVGLGPLPAGHRLEAVAQLLGVRLEALSEVNPTQEGGDVAVLLVLRDAVACLRIKR